MQSVFLPRTTLSPDEQRINFTMMDNAVIDLLTSDEAQQACSLMWTIYTRLRRADWRLFERQGVLFVGGDGTRTAWQVLCDLAGAASATLRKALKWMAEKKVIAYFAGKNGVGIRIYFNVALASVKPKQKNLRLVPTSSGDAPASANEVPSWDSKAIPKNIQNSDIRADARDDEAPEATTSTSSLPSAPTDHQPPTTDHQPPPRPPLRLVPPPEIAPPVEVQLALSEALLQRFTELERLVQELLQNSVTRAWLQKAGLPLIARVSASEAIKHNKRDKPPREADVGVSQPTFTPEEMEEMLALARAYEAEKGETL